MSDATEAVNIAVADFSPVNELDTQFKGTLNLLHEIDLVNFEYLVEGFKVWNSRLAHTDGSYFFGLDEAYLAPLTENFDHCGRCHPACCAASDDNYFADLLFHGRPKKSGALN